MPLPTKAHIGAYSALIDKTSYGTILAYYRSETSDIDGILFAHPELPLDYVAATLERHTTDPECSQQFFHWMELGDLVTPGPPSKPTRPELLALDPDKTVRCLYLPPLYLIQFVID